MRNFLNNEQQLRVTFSCFNTMIVPILVFVLHFLPRIISAATNICFLIDETQASRTTKYSIEEKIQLARNISRCLRSAKDTNIATVIYDNNSAKLGFNFKNIDDILNDGFQQMIVNQRQRRNTQESYRYKNKSLKRTTIRFFSNTKGKKFTDTDSPQTMAFLTAAEAVVAAESQGTTGQISNFKVLVISDSEVFPVMDDVKNYFLNASVEINAVDLSKDGSSELERIVTVPSAEHYFHSSVINPGLQSIIDGVCKTLLKAPLMQKHATPFFNVNKLFTRPLKDMTSFYAKQSPQYHYEETATGNTDLTKNLDGVIESDSLEYKWSPQPELEPAEFVEEIQDTPEELYDTGDKKDICKYLHDECNTHMQAGLCTVDNPQAQGMKKFCKTTCGFCGSAV